MGTLLVTRCISTRNKKLLVAPGTATSRGFALFHTAQLAGAALSDSQGCRLEGERLQELQGRAGRGVCFFSPLAEVISDCLFDAPQ